MPFQLVQAFVEQFGDEGIDTSRRDNIVCFTRSEESLMKLWHVSRLESQVSGAVDRQDWRKYANYARKVLRR